MSFVIDFFWTSIRSSEFKRGLIFVVAMLASAFLPIFGILLAQQNAESGLFPSPIDKYRYEVGKIQFPGAESFDASELKSIIGSKETIISPPHALLNYYYQNFKENRAAPRILVKNLEKNLEYFDSEYKFFNKLQAENDVAILEDYYNQRGYHEVTVGYEFYPDSSIGENVLSFSIYEGPRYTLAAIERFGLDELPLEVKNKIDRVESVETPTPFQEQDVMNDIRNIKRQLRNSGYYFADFEKPTVLADTSAKTDTVVAAFQTGKRYRFGDIDFVDSLKGQAKVVDAMKSKQLAFRSGGWYSAAKVNQSVGNMLSLGSFELVSIDTSNNFDRSADTTIPFTVFTQYKKQQEYGLSFFVNEDAVGKQKNVGTDFSYFNRNIFGAAQVANPFVRVTLLDISRALSDLSKYTEPEYRIGFNFAQPLLWTIDNSRVGLSSQFSYSFTKMNNILPLHALRFPVKFRVYFPEITYFNEGAVNFDLTYEKPYNFEEAEAKAVAEATTPEEIANAIRTFNNYSILNDFTKEKKPILTSNLIAFSLIGDTRDNFFSPTRGYYTSLTFEFTDYLFYPFDYLAEVASSEPGRVLGAAKFIKVHLSNNWYWKVNKNAVLALKQREGYIFWFDKANSYVPFESQFLAGGANSVRGWASRRLRYSKEFNPDVIDQDIYDIFSDFIGNAALIEGSAEYRYRFDGYAILGGPLAETLSNFGVTGFVDWGNAFFTMATDDNGEYIDKYQLKDFFEGIALASGFGLRYETPVGPARLDIAWKVYDPLDQKSKFIVGRPGGLSDFRFHVGLGNAF